MPPTIVEAKKLQKPVGNLSSQMLSIKQMEEHNNKGKNQEIVDYSNRSENTFTIDQLKMVWKQFAFKMRENGSDSIYFALTKREPWILNGNEIHQDIDNHAQLEGLQEKMPDLLDFVRQKLKNWSITIEFKLNTSQEENIKLLTGKDKFEALAKKNVNLFSFQKTFNLDIDY